MEKIGRLERVVLRNEIKNSSRGQASNRTDDDMDISVMYTKMEIEAMRLICL